MLQRIPATVRFVSAEPLLERGRFKALARTGGALELGNRRWREWAVVRGRWIWIGSGS